MMIIGVVVINVHHFVCIVVINVHHSVCIVVVITISVCPDTFQYVNERPSYVFV